MWSGIANWGHRPGDCCNTLAAATKRSNSAVLAGCVCGAGCFVCAFVVACGCKRLFRLNNGIEASDCFRPPQVEQPMKPWFTVHLMFTCDVYVRSAGEPAVN